MDLLGAFGGGGGGDPFGALRGFGQMIATRTHVATARISRLNRIAAEINRYIKDRNQRIIAEPPPTRKPSVFADYEFERYEYSRLGLDKSIRLLKLQPSGKSGWSDSKLNGDEFISCKLEEVALGANPKYEALSYTWGTLPLDFPILIKGDGFPAQASALFITPTLYAALKRLRHPSEERVLWIDQICINQGQDDRNTEEKKKEINLEKSRQILLMGEIYEKAMNAVVWLGEEDKDKVALEEMINLFDPGNPSTLQADINLIRPKLDLPGKNVVSTTQGDLGRLRHQALIRLLNRQWFTRAWIFQEAVKSPKVSITWGSVTLPLEILLRLCQAVDAIEEDAQGYAYSLTKTTTGFDTLYLIQHSRPHGCGDEECERNGFNPGFLGLLMQALQQFEAKMDHDLIYAFLAFRENVDITLVDYNQPVSVVWREAARDIIKSTKSLDIFAAVRGDQPCTKSIPSWVPDWSHCYPYARPICAPDFKSNFNACNALLDPANRQNPEAVCPHIWQNSSSDDPDTLVVVGKMLGVIAWLSPPNFEGRYYRDGLKEVFVLDQHVTYLRREIAHPTKANMHLQGGIKEQLIRTMLADGAFGFKQPLSDEPADIIRICDEEEKIESECQAAESGALSPEIQKEKDALSRCRQWSLITQQKKIILCEGAEDGVLDLGLAPNDVHQGDLVCLLRGSRAPCVLRRVGAESKRYRIIGQCYVDGWMYGEVPAGRTWPAGGEEEFCLV